MPDFVYWFWRAYFLIPHVRSDPCRHGMARPQVVDGGDSLQCWRVTTNMLNRQSRTADKGWSSSLGAVRGANKSLP
jgi:hypothetical protein